MWCDITLGEQNVLCWHQKVTGIMTARSERKVQSKYWNSITSLSLERFLLAIILSLGILSSVLTRSCTRLSPFRCVSVLSGQPGDWWEWKEQRANPPDLERPVKGLPGHCRPLPPGSTPGSQVGRGQTHCVFLSNRFCFQLFNKRVKSQKFEAAPINYV